MIASRPQKQNERRDQSWNGRRRKRRGSTQRPKLRRARLPRRNTVSNRRERVFPLLRSRRLKNSQTGTLLRVEIIFRTYVIILRGFLRATPTVTLLTGSISLFGPNLVRNLG